MRSYLQIILSSVLAAFVLLSLLCLLDQCFCQKAEMFSEELLLAIDVLLLFTVTEIFTIQRRARARHDLWMTEALHKHVPTSGSG